MTPGLPLPVRAVSLPFLKVAVTSKVFFLPLIVDRTAPLNVPEGDVAARATPADTASTAAVAMSFLLKPYVVISLRSWRLHGLASGVNCPLRPHPALPPNWLPRIMDQGAGRSPQGTTLGFCRAVVGRARRRSVGGTGPDAAAFRRSYGADTADRAAST